LNAGPPLTAGALRAGHDGNIALDGPNGPYHQPKPGVFKIAEKAEMLIIPTGLWYSKSIVLKNRWDKFRFPLPFTKYHLEIGDPFIVSGDIDDKPKLQENIVYLSEKMAELKKIAEEKGRAQIIKGARGNTASLFFKIIQLFKKIFLIAIYYLTGLTSKMVNNPDAWLVELKASGKNILFAVWHEATAGCFWYYRRRQAVILREDSPKGDVLAAMSSHFGYKDFKITDNPNDRVSAKGTIQFIKHLREGHDGVIALDGPNGPYHEPKPGIFAIAQKSNSQVVPVGVWYSSKFILKSRWDKYQIPLPFSKIVILIGAPILAPEKMDEAMLANKLKELTDKIGELTKKAEEIGRNS